MADERSTRAGIVMVPNRGAGRRPQRTLAGLMPRERDGAALSPIGAWISFSVCLCNGRRVEAWTRLSLAQVGSRLPIQVVVDP